MRHHTIAAQKWINWLLKVCSFVRKETWRRHVSLNHAVIWDQLLVGGPVVLFVRERVHAFEHDRAPRTDKRHKAGLRPSPAHGTAC